MAVPKMVLHLVETFDRNVETYKANQLYNETQLRREFIDPFFEALGWDITNKQGYAPAYRDVIHEDAIKIGSETKAPDYCFRIGGARKFFLEAKKPSVDVKGDPHPAYQLRRYAWSAKLPLSILTDFEEFAVYDCQSKPLESDSSSTARIMFLNYKDYPDNWDKIADIFGKDAVLKGSFDKFITSTKTKRGTTTVDIEFLSEIENWRQAFAKTIAHRNTNLTVEQINFAVQKTVDRILFLRMCEDRGIETYGQLLSFINGDNVYPRLCTLFEKADAKYNSGIFHFHKEPDRTEPPDELTLNLSIDDRDLKYIINSLYYPKSPYVFSVLPPEILGNVYEQFLGKIIRLTPARQVKIEEKPEVKKAGGIYYTPSYIVDYIVKNTVGRLCEGKTPKEIEKIKILDPACGSGSFLLGAYTYLLNYIRDWYVEHNPQNFPKQIYQLRQGQYFLTISEKKKILLNNIFGVDIDSQAVEVTKLSLLLKTLEGETSETVGQTYKMFHERALPDLADNIKCGNSLIGPDFFDNKDPTSIDPDEYKRINPFDWQKEFPQIFSRKNTGFDIVIGNPPWVDIKGMDPELVDFYFASYCTTQNRMNIYATFLHKAIELLRPKGLLGFITPNSYLTQSSYKNLRQFILHHSSPLNIVRMPDAVFPNVKAESVIGIFVKYISDKCSLLVYPPHAHISSISKDDAIIIETVNPRLWEKSVGFIFNIFTGNDEQNILKKISSGKSQLSDICDFCLGLTPYDKYKGHTIEQIENKVFHAHSKKDKYFKPLLSGAGITRYSVEWDGAQWIRYGDWLGAPREPKFFRNPRILIRQIISGDPLRIYCGYTEQELYNTQIAFNVLLKQDMSISLKYILGILNSKLITFYHRYCFLDQSKKTFQKILIQDAKKFPIYMLDFGNPDDKVKHDKMVKLVEQMLNLHKKLAESKIPDEKTRVQRQIPPTDKSTTSFTTSTA
jgi:type I restriction-modification system DNA methylase subunit